VGLSEAIGEGPTALDTVAFIYLIEQHPDFLPLVKPLFEEADAGKRELVTSAVTLLEVLVVPYREGNRPLAQRYEELLTRGRGLKLVDLDRDLLRAAALLRARYGVRSPDALQMAAALAAGCPTLVTNDRRLPSIPSLRIVQLGDFM
jgi:predicted nucleic acid-binding protein